MSSKIRKRILALVITTTMVVVPFGGHGIVFASTTLDNAIESEGLHMNSYVPIDDSSSDFGYVPYHWVDEDGNEVKTNQNVLTNKEISSMSNSSSVLRGSSTSTLESSYKTEVTSVKNQDQYGLCWAFSTLSSLESNLLVKGLGTYDLSEKHLANYTYDGYDEDTSSRTYGDGYINSDSTALFYGGGNELDAISALESWWGPELESNCSFEDLSNENTPLASDVVVTERYHKNAYVKEHFIINAKSNQDLVKAAIKEYGAGMVGINAIYDDYSIWKNYHNGTESNPTTLWSTSPTTVLNHAVSVVGWDDNFSKDYFGSSSNKPSSNGAWLMKNSWGTDWGQAGYFWISYEDNNNVGDVYFINADTDTSDEQYNYCGAGVKNYYYTSSELQEANVFTADKALSLNSIGIDLPKAALSYTADIYVKDGTSAMTAPLDGTKKETLTGTASFAGKKEVSLTTPLELEKGQSFSVVVTLKDATNYYIYVEGSDSSYNSSTLKHSSKSGQSYLKISGIWSDTVSSNSYHNVGICAYTSQIEPYQLTQDLPTDSGLTVVQDGNDVVITKGTCTTGLTLQDVYLNNDEVVFTNNVCTLKLTEDSRLYAFYSRPISSISDMKTYVETPYSDECPYTLYELNTDLDFSSTTWTSPAFTGSFNGNNHVISGLKTTLFDSLDYGQIVVKLKIKNAVITATKNYSGGIVNECAGGIGDCSFDGTFNTAYSYNGGIVGKLTTSGVVVNCANYGNINYTATGISNNYLGGIAGYSDGQVGGCYSGGTITKGTGLSCASLAAYLGDNASLTYNYWLSTVADSTGNGYVIGGYEKNNNIMVTQDEIDTGKISYDMQWSYDIKENGHKVPVIIDSDHVHLVKMKIKCSLSDVVVGGVSDGNYLYGKPGETYSIALSDGSAFSTKYRLLKVNDVDNTTFTTALPSEEGTISISAISVNSFRVTFIAGTITVSSTTTSGGSVNPPNLTKTGYSLVWDSTEYTNVTKDLTITGTWTPNKYAVTLNDACGGTTSFDATYDSAYGSNLDTVPTRTNYKFDGWFTQASGGTQVTSSTVVSTASNHTLYAHWTAVASTDTYTVTLDDGCGGTTLFDATYGSVYGDKLNTVPTRTNYKFDGWFTEASGGTQVTSSTIVSTASNHTLYAHWTLVSISDTYTVKFIVGTNTISYTKIPYGGSVNPPTIGNVKTGYTGGWDSKEYTNVTKDLTINWAWTPNVYSVTLDTGLGITKAMSVTYDSCYGVDLPTTLTRSGYVFNGWFTSPTGGTQVTSSTTVNTASNHTLYAHWTADSSSDGTKDDGSSSTTTTVKVNKTIYFGNLKIKLTRTNDVAQATVVGTKNKKVKSVSVPKKITYKGYSYPVKAIASNAFKNCKKLKTLVIKSTTLTSVGKNALKGAYKSIKIKVPSSKKKAYTKLFKNKGLKKITIK